MPDYDDDFQNRYYTDPTFDFNALVDQVFDEGLYDDDEDDDLWDDED